MRALRIHHQGGIDDLAFEDAPDPDPPTGDVLVRVRAAGFTPNELTWPSTYVDRAGRDRTPAVVAHELSGTVVAIGFGTSGFAVGDEVFGLADSYRDGAAAELVSVEARNLAIKPSRVGHAHAASLPQAALAAWQGLFDHGQVEAGTLVMVHGAAGAVGGVAVQLARHAGATVIGTGLPDAKELALGLGAHSFIDLTDGSGLDRFGRPEVVFDTIGGDVLSRSASLVAPGGRLISIVVPPPPLDDAAGVLFVVEPNRGQLTHLAALVDSGVLQPHVAAEYALRDGQQAFRDKRDGLNGKVVLLP